MTILRYFYDKSGNLVFQKQEQPNDPPSRPIVLGTSRPQIVPKGGTVTLSVVMADSQGVGFQWWYTGRSVKELPGETRDSLVLANFDASMDGAYQVDVEKGTSETGGLAFAWLDSTGNLLPDFWQMEHFGNLTSQRAAADPDQDGISNLDEFMDNTIPVDKTSQRPRLIAYSDVGGSVTVNPTQLSYGFGDWVTLQATAFPGYVFDGWDRDLQGTTNPTRLLLDRSKKVRAKMRRL
jgi:List-Bact-rpt repeat protein